MQRHRLGASPDPNDDKPEEVTPPWPSFEEYKKAHAEIVTPEPPADEVPVEEALEAPIEVEDSPAGELTPAAPAPSKPKSEPVSRPKSSSRRERGVLEAQVKAVCLDLSKRDAFAELTATEIARAVERNLDDGKRVSPGAVTALLKRWAAYGYVNVGYKPFRFVDFTEAAFEVGLTELKKRHRKKGKKDE